MHDLKFTPGDHAAAPRGADEFQPGKHNWLRANKVPMLVLNATTVNTGHAWQFTPTWMGESPWAVHEEADSIPRLEWSWYDAENGWTMEVARAVAASACVPGVFAPLEIPDAYRRHSGATCRWRRERQSRHGLVAGAQTVTWYWSVTLAVNCCWKRNRHQD